MQNLITKGEQFLVLKNLVTSTDNRQDIDALIEWVSTNDEERISVEAPILRDKSLRVNEANIPTVKVSSLKHLVSGDNLILTEDVIRKVVPCRRTTQGKRNAAIVSDLKIVCHDISSFSRCLAYRYTLHDRTDID